VGIGETLGPTGVVPGTYTKVTVNTFGQVTIGATAALSDLTGTLQCSQFPALTGDLTTSEGSCATALSTTGVGGGEYGQVTVDTKGRVTAAQTVSDMTHGGTDVSSAADDGVLVSSGAAWQLKVLADCTGANKAVTYDAATNAWGCNDITVGTGTVTNAGDLTANALILGNGGVDITALGSLGTTTTVLHGNAAGAPTWAAVDLTTTVTNVLPMANGGTDVSVAADDTILISNDCGRVVMLIVPGLHPYP
jgi:hypothetical protein